MTEAFGQPRRLSRRRVLTAAAGAAVVSTVSVTHTEQPASALEWAASYFKTLAENNLPEFFHPKYVDVNSEGQYVLSDTPKTVEINSFEPVDLKHEHNKWITLRQKPHHNATTGAKEIESSKLNERKFFGVPVIGSAEVKKYPSGTKTFYYKGTEIKGAVWYLLTDKDGNPINPQGENDGKSYYVEEGSVQANPLASAS